ncbi:hypothetical protein [Microvirga makkahensis]|uniref:Uncharacterized protein n=1 Tax=Microvirga makkahensis TaxID=1128670 RepID=A0A7X3SQM4_9HYPH|nr:hypothetical protein [Microvirga makkahensis]MXQ13716.1 hypothetical protein [Microvirga makkahensis]
MDWSIPSFDSGSQFHFTGQDLHAGPASKFLRMHQEWLAKGQVRLPFPDVVFLLERPDLHLLIRAQENDDESIVLAPFCRPKNNDPGPHRPKYGGPISRSPIAIRFSRHAKIDHLNGYMPDFQLTVEEGAVTGLPTDYLPWVRGIISDALLCSFALAVAKPDDNCSVFADSGTPDLASANKRRARAGPDPVPATKTLTIRFTGGTRLWHLAQRRCQGLDTARL